MSPLNRSRLPVTGLIGRMAPATAPRAPIISIRSHKTHCASCGMRELCLSDGLEPAALHDFDTMVTSQSRLKRGETIYRAGEPFTALYAIRLGSCKTSIVTEDGREQLIGYHMPGDVVGLDGIGTERHASQAIALEDSEVCPLPFDRLEELARTLPSLQHNLHRILSRDIGCDQNMMLVLGSMRGEERLAALTCGHWASSVNKL